MNTSIPFYRPDRRVDGWPFWESWCPQCKTWGPVGSHACVADKDALKARGYRVQFMWASAGVFRVYYAFCGAVILGSKNSSEEAWDICREDAAYFDHRQQEAADERAHMYADRDAEMSPQFDPRGE